MGFLCFHRAQPTVNKRIRQQKITNRPVNSHTRSCCFTYDVFRISLLLLELDVAVTYGNEPMYGEYAESCSVRSSTNAIYDNGMGTNYR